MEKRVWSILFRYVILAIIAIPGFDIFYYLFSPLTTYPVYGFLNLFFDPVLIGSTIIIGQKTIEIVGACVAGSAYYLLLILNLSTPKINFSKRILFIFSSFGAFLIINIIRIWILSLMYLNNSPLFDIAHKIFWYLGSTIFVVLIWFIGVWIFKIDKFPIYSDLKYLYSSTKRLK